jgi:hypothetical protein
MTEALARLLERNASEVFGERDRARRRLAIAEIFAGDCSFFDAEGRADGQDAIDAKAEGILGGAPPEFELRPTGPAEVIHDLGRVRWGFGPPGAPPAVTGTDIAVFAGGRIRALYTFLDPTPPLEDR